MECDLARELRLPAGNPDQLWELFHENSKTSRFQGTLSDEEVLSRLARLCDSLAYEAYPVLELPPPMAPLPMSLGQALTARVTARGLVPVLLTLETVGTLLHYAYGITRTNQDAALPRPLRVVPSGGALYPLEIFLHSAHIPQAAPGVYHYNPLRHDLRRLRQGDESSRLAAALVQPHLATDAALFLMITALFERSTFKYGDRGYRFALLEAGHVAQNVSLVATALGLGCVTIGGYFDRQLDDWLDLDGLTHSTIYLIAIGKPVSAS